MSDIISINTCRYQEHKYMSDIISISNNTG